MRRFTLQMMLLALATMVMPIGAWAHDFEINGIYYNITSSTEDMTMTVEVTFCGDGHDPILPSPYEGNIVIPPTVTYENRTYSVTKIGFLAFAYAHEVSSVSIPESVKEIEGRVFFEKEGSVDIYITDLTAWCNVYFQNKFCTNFNLYANGQLIDELVIPESVAAINSYTFNGCKSITSVVIPNNVKRIERYAFENCLNLKEVIIKDGVDELSSDGYKVFADSLEKVYIGRNLNSSFYGMSNLNSIVLADSVTYIRLGSFNETGWYKNQPDGVVYAGKLLYTYKGEMPINTSVEVREGTFAINQGAFDGHVNLTSINIPEGVTSIGESAFSDCEQLSSVSIPEGVTAIGECAFYSCYNLVSIGLPETLVSIGPAVFRYCSNLVSVTIPQNVTDIGNYAFDGCI